jgi:hypothetical protein
MEKHMEFQEYPKALYLAGQALIVDNPEQEDTARADGYDDWHADHARTETVDTSQGDSHTESIKGILKTTFPPISESVNGSIATPLDREALKARAAELGVKHAPNIGTDKLAALVAEAEGK